MTEIFDHQEYFKFYHDTALLRLRTPVGVTAVKSSSLCKLFNPLLSKFLKQVHYIGRYILYIIHLTMIKNVSNTSLVCHDTGNSDPSRTARLPATHLRTQQLRRKYSIRYCWLGNN